MRNILKNTTVNCDNCGKSFKIKKLKTKWINDNVQRVYFTCPYCKQEYTSFYTDDRIRKNIKKIDDLQRQYDEIIKENKEIMKELREKYDQW
jgi:transcription elongation factor Elf1